jgi:hypothetical protein
VFLGLKRLGVLKVSGAVSGLLLSLAVSGCGSANPWETVYPATGKVTFKGKPVVDAEIALFPEDGSAPETVRPRAKTAGDGAFAVWTYERGDGAPAGRYKATIVHHEVVVSNGAMGVKPNSLPRKYASPTTTDLFVEIAQGETDIPTIELR